MTAIADVAAVYDVGSQVVMQRDVLTTAGKHVDAAQCVQLIGCADRLINESLDVDDFGSARHFAHTALVAAKRLKLRLLLKRANAMQKQVQELVVKAAVCAAVFGLAVNRANTLLAESSSLAGMPVTCPRTSRSGSRSGRRGRSRGCSRTP